MKSLNETGPSAEPAEVEALYMFAAKAPLGVGDVANEAPLDRSLGAQFIFEFCEHAKARRGV